MIITILGALLALVSLVRALFSLSSLAWAKEFNRVILGLLMIGFSVMPEWGLLAVVLDATLIMLCFFTLRMTVQAEGEGNE